MADQLTRTLYDKALEWALDIDEDACRREITKLREKYPGESERELAERLVRRYALIAFGEGALTGALGGPLTALPAALFDSAFVMRASARLNGATGELAEGGYLGDDDAWRADVVTMVGDKAVAQQAMRRTAVRAVQKFTARVGARTMTKLVPVVGAAVGGVWNYMEVRQLGRTFVRYHFTERAASGAPNVTDVDDGPIDV